MIKTPFRQRTFVAATPCFIAMLNFLPFTEASAQSNMFRDYYSVYNPAMSGVMAKQDAGLTAIYQPNKYSYDYQGYYARYNARVAQLHGGIGVNFSRGQLSRYADNQLNVNYSYHIRTGEHSLLALGVSAGLLQYGYPTPGYSMEEGKIENGTGITSGIGISYRYKQFHTGISINNLNEPLIKTANTSIRFQRTYTFFADYTWNISEKLALQPSVLIQSGEKNLSHPSIEGSLRAILKDKYWVGVSASNTTMGIMLGYNFNKRFSLGYSYQWPNKVFERGAHGITLKFQIN